MPSVISPFFARELKAERVAAARLQAEAQMARVTSERERGEAEEKRTRREVFDKWNLREKPGPATAEVFADRGPKKLTTIVHSSQRGDPTGAALTEALRAAKLGIAPREPAGIAKTRAEAEEVRYGTEFKQNLEDVLEGTVRSYGREAKARAGEAALGVSEERRRIGLRDKTGIIAATAAETRAAEAAEVEAEAAKPVEPKRKLRSDWKRWLWEGRPEIGAPGLGAPIKGYMDIAGLLKEYAGEGYEYAFPRTK